MEYTHLNSELYGPVMEVGSTRTYFPLFKIRPYRFQEEMVLIFSEVIIHREYLI
jgi:hypothetical protein